MNVRCDQSEDGSAANRSCSGVHTNERYPCGIGHQEGHVGCQSLRLRPPHPTTVRLTARWPLPPHPALIAQIVSKYCRSSPRNVGQRSLAVDRNNYGQRKSQSVRSQVDARPAGRARGPAPRRKGEHRHRQGGALSIPSAGRPGPRGNMDAQAVVRRRKDECCLNGGGRNPEHLFWQKHLNRPKRFEALKSR
jgi:hypothetical protein